MFQRYTESWDELRHVIPAAKYAHFGLTGSPFQPLSCTESLRLRMCGAAVHLAERLVGVPLYAENEYRELAMIEPRVCNLLLKLIKEGLVTDWRIGQAVPDLPPVVSCNLTLKEIVLPSGKKMRMGGSTGGGVGWTLSEALVPALGEILERYSMTQWHEGELVRGTYDDLHKNGAIDPKLFSFYSEKQLSRSEFARNRIQHNASFHWTHARSLLEERDVLVPAQLAYVFYGDNCPDATQFWETSSSGVAAGISYADATARAILEAVERDAFMIFWLNQLTPPRVRLDTIPDVDVTRLIDECARYRLELYVLDCTSDLGIPTFVTVIIDQHGSMPVSVSAASDFDPLIAIRKSVWEGMKLSRVAPKIVDGSLSPEKIMTIQDRYRFLYTVGREYVSFLLMGAEQSYDETIARHRIEMNRERVGMLARLLREKKYPCYLVDLTTPEAREAELCVVRAIIPDLVPLHFREAKPHLGVQRLYEVPLRMGYGRGAKDESEINTRPHPFL